MAEIGKEQEMTSQHNLELRITALKNRIVRLERALNQCGRAETIAEVRAIVGRTLRRRAAR